jgi:cytochrome c5
VEQDYVDAVKERLAPFARVAVAGQDNSALAIVEKEGSGEAGAGAAEGGPASGTDVFAQACAACHGQGIAGAPKAGDKAAWAARIAKGNDTLYKHAIEGYQGEAGLMPAKGGRPDISDDLVRAAVDHMVEMSR